MGRMVTVNKANRPLRVAVGTIPSTGKAAISPFDQTTGWGASPGAPEDPGTSNLTRN